MEVDAHKAYLSRPFDYMDRILAKKNEVDIDMIMVARELKKQYRLQYKRASKYLSILTSKLVASIEEDSEPENPIDGQRLMQDYYIPERPD